MIRDDDFIVFISTRSSRFACILRTFAPALAAQLINTQLQQPGFGAHCAAHASFADLSLVINGFNSTPSPLNENIFASIMIFIITQAKLLARIRKYLS